MSHTYKKIKTFAQKFYQWSLFICVNMIFIFVFPFIGTVLVMLAFVFVTTKLYIQPSANIVEWSIVLVFVMMEACYFIADSRTTFFTRFARKVSGLSDDDFNQTERVKLDRNKL